MLNQEPKKRGLLDLLRCMVFVVLAAVSGFLVWSFHNNEWLGFIGYFVVSVFVGGMAGGLVGVRLLPCLLTMAVFSGVMEGVHLGWQRYGWMGVAPGGLVGSIVALIVVLLPVMLTHLVMVLRGIDPFADADSQE